MFKVKVVRDAIKGMKTAAEIAQKHDMYPNQMTAWRPQLLKRALDEFGTNTKAV